MGIPKYFRHITHNNPRLILENLSITLNNLYLDLNCLVHPCVKKIEAQYPALVKKHNLAIKQNTYNTLENIGILTEFEKKSFDMVYDYILKLIEFSEPDEMLYIAIDGTAPRAKMQQQRSRRVRSVKEHKMRIDILKKYDNLSEYFDSNCITPGTIFMKKLSNYLKSKINEMSKNSKYKHLDYYLDDSSIRGEGEHKILQHIKNYAMDKQNCIYGLDADLIMLALVSKAQVYLLRESVHFGKVNMDELLFFDVLQFKSELFDSIKSQIDENTDIPEDDDSYSENNSYDELDMDRVINDYICLCFFIGNDFLPAIVGIDINTGGINSLIDIYCQIFSIRRKYLVDDENNINFIFVRQILTNLFANEDNYLVKYQKRIDYGKPRMEYGNDMERELLELNYYPVFNKNNYLKLGSNDWRNLYDKYYFNIGNPIKDSALINKICENYIEGLQWNIKYYLESCVSYSWFYKYQNAPLLKYLVVYLIDRIYPKNFKDESYTAFEQLAIVLPKESSHLWCKEYKNIVDRDLNLLINYPSNFKLDTLNKFYLHDCEPVLCEFNDDYLRSVFKKINLNSLEEEISKDGELFIVSNKTIQLKIS